jgi:ABC-type uncharacterized transport system substrate-binding protein
MLSQGPEGLSLIGALGPWRCDVLSFRRLELRSVWPQVLASAPQGTAGAHPHVFIENHVKPQFENGALVGFAVDWLFDDFFSDEIVRRFDLNRDRRFDGPESAEVEQHAFANLKSYGYFVHVRAGEREVALRDATDFTPSIEKKLLRYRFVVRLEKPLALRDGPIRAGFYDDSYYVDLAFAAKSGVDLSQLPKGCAARVAEDTANPIYLGAVYPQTLFIECR